MTKLGTTDLDVYGLCLGGNVFGWTADEEASFAILDAYAGAGGNFIDTADVYGARMNNGVGGLSEEVLGRWFAARGNRSSIVLATKVAMKESRLGLSGANILAAADESLERLGSDYIDLYYAHRDDPETPLEETLGAFDALVRAGKVRYIAASNYTAPRLAEALAVSEREGFARYSALQNHYNLLERSEYEDRDRPVPGQGVDPLAAVLRPGARLPGRQVPPRRRGRVGAGRGRGEVPDRAGLCGALGARRDRRGARRAGGGRLAGLARRAADRGRADRLGAHRGAARRTAAERRP
jgi:hypothetical protein